LLFRTTPEEEARRLRVIGLAVVVVAFVVVSIVVSDPFRGRPVALMSVVIETQYVGQGVDVGTAVIMHGVEIGQVTGVSSLPGGGVRLNADLQSAVAADLTDTLSIDYRPENYFGVTGVNLVRGDGGRPLEDGMRIQTTPRGNFALQKLLSRLGEITDGVVTPQLVQVIDRSTAYVDGLSPLIETILMVMKAVDNVQTVSTARLLANATGLSAVFPSFVDAAVESGHRFDNAGLVVFDHTGGEVTEEFWQNHYLPTVELATYGLFGAASWSRRMSTSCCQPWRSSRP
jgi:ABC-type transporter Mla subunit MlaD